MPTANRHKNPRRMGGGALKRPKKQKNKITTKIGFKLVPKSVINGVQLCSSEAKELMCLRKKIFHVKHDYLTSFKIFYIRTIFLRAKTM